MIEKQNIRQILAILVTDIADWTETFNDDESKGMQYVKMQRDIIPPIINRMNGHLFKEMGDGTFSKFKSAIEAVQCAITIKEEASKNDLPIRIAVHLGDVMDDGVDVIGMGVNVASRINSLGSTGTIVVSEDVWKQVRSQSDMDGTSIGKKDIKGYHQSIEIFELTYNPDGSITQKVKVTETVTVTDEEGKKVQTESAKKDFIKKLAIFPFEGEGEEMEYLKYGFPFGCSVTLLQDPLMEVEFPNVMELSSHSFSNKMKSYDKEKALPLPLKKKISNEIHCDYFMAGKLESQNGKLQVACKIHNAKNGKLIGEIIKSDSNLFTLIDGISVQARRALGIPSNHIEETENLPIAEILTEDTTTYEKYIKGIILREFENDYKKSFNLVKEATLADSSFSLANYTLALTGFLSNDEALKEEGEQAINNSLAHLYKLPDRFSYVIKLVDFFQFKNDPPKAEKVVDMWRRQYPESIAPLTSLGSVRIMRMNHKGAIDAFNEVLSKDPHYHEAYLIIHRCFLRLNDLENALLFAKTYLKHCPSDVKAFRAIGGVYFEMGDFEKAKDYYEQALMIETDNANSMVKIAEADMSLGNFSDAEDQLKDALLFCKSPADYADVYMAMGECYEACGKIKESISLLDRQADYINKYTNPIDSKITNMLNLRPYGMIGEKDIALKKMKEISENVSKPFNLVVGLGHIFLCDYTFNKDKDLVRSGTQKLKDLTKELKREHFKFLCDFGDARILLFDDKFEEALPIYTEILEKSHGFFNSSSINIDIMICYSGLKDYDSSIKEGLRYLKSSPMKGTVILQLSKAYLGKGDTDKANEYLTKLLSIWENADEEYLPFQEARALWKKINKKKPKD